MSIFKDYYNRRKWKSDIYPAADLKKHGLKPTPTSSHHDTVSCRFCNHRAFDWVEQTDIPHSTDVLPWLHRDECAQHVSKQAADSNIYLKRAYTPLRNDGSQIRVVELHPPDSSPFIRCSLEIVNRQDQPEYQALSYRWGDKYQARPFFILLNDVVWRVTPNLYHALQDLQLKDHTRCLWIDALAINQFDDEEKSHQVRLMAEIYSGSSQTQIWLNEKLELLQASLSKNKVIFSGDPADDVIRKEYKRTYINFDNIPGSTAEPLSKMGQNCGCCPDQPVFESLEQEHYLGALCLLSYLSEDIHIHELPFVRKEDDNVLHCSSWAYILLAINSLVLSPWFERLWIVQEAVLSPNSTVCFGNHRFPFDMLLKAQRNWFRHKSTCCSATHARLPIMQQNIFRMLAEKVGHFKPDIVTKSNSLTYTVWRALSQQATDPRDKIFGVLSLMSDEYKACIGTLLPNYKLTQSQCFILSASLMVTERWENRSLRMLSLVRKQTTDKLKLPSWIPDWSSYDPLWNPRLFFTKSYRASAELYIKPCPRNRFLALGNIAVDVVKTVGTRLTTYNHGKTMFNTICQWQKMAKFDQSSHCTHNSNKLDCCKQSSEQFLEAFCRTLTSDRSKYHVAPTDDGRPVRAGDDDWRDVARLLEWGAEHQEQFQYELVPADLQPTFTSLIFSLYHRTFFVSELGLFGLGPIEMIVGDEIRVLFGSDAPFIIRPAHDYFRWTFSSAESDLLVQDSSGVADSQEVDSTLTYLSHYSQRQLRIRGAAVQSHIQPYSDFVAAAFIDWIMTETLDLAAAQAAFAAGQQKTMRMMTLARSNPSIAEIFEQAMEDFQKAFASQNLSDVVQNGQAAVNGKAECAGLYDTYPGGMTRTHHLIGDCYVHGIMDGQMVAGFNEDLLKGSLTRTEVTPFDRIILE